MFQGVQLIGRRYREDLGFDSTEIIEQQRGVFTPIEPRDTQYKGLTTWRRGSSRFHKANLKGGEDMTKAKARQRAKAKAAQKVRKREANADRPEQKIRPGQFDPGASSIKGPAVNAGIRNFAGARRGAARSR